MLTSAYDNNRYCHANWVDAKILYNGRRPATITFPSRPPEILTPPAPSTPRVNGPTVFGVRPGNPFLYTIPATGDRPMKFAVDELPAGLTVDESTGRITGAIAARGEYYTTLRATNALGTAEKKFRIVAGDTISLTPAMGWNSWNVWGDQVDQEKVIRAARALVKSGLVNHGWTYINIDDAWQSKRGGEFNAIQPNGKFPDMKGLCDEIHAMGLKVGIYSTPWVESYAGYIGGSAENPEGTWEKDKTRAPKNRRVLPFHLGKHSFAKADAQQWAAWGIDYLKYDWAPIDVASAREMYDALLGTRRDIVYSLSNNATANVLSIAGELSKFVNSWRTTNDIVDTWRNMSNIGFNQDAWAPHQSPGHFGDPDMLVVGYVGWGKPHPTRLTPDEQYSHISLWCLLGSPLLIGCDMEKLDEFTISLLTNDEVLAINQDPLGKQAVHVSRGENVHVYMKELEDGSRAVGLFNTGPTEATCTAGWSDLKVSGKQTVRDLWRQTDIGVFEKQYETTLPPHGVRLLRITRAP
ncbi:MAG: putative Ig domain-containing protein [Burkholderiales bacterium]|nr:putative Ig domain-containing protein [Phycisphaerae bacterium]